MSVLSDRKGQAKCLTFSFFYAIIYVENNMEVRKMYCNAAELDRLLTATERCKKGLCSQCEYTENCMDGIIDDVYDFLENLNGQFTRAVSELD